MDIRLQLILAAGPSVIFLLLRFARNRMTMVSRGYLNVWNPGPTHIESDWNARFPYDEI